MPAHREQFTSPHAALLLSLSASLLEAQEEGSILRAAMRTGCEVVQAEGCVFMPFGEYTQTLPALEFGRTPPLVHTDWNTLLTRPPTRQVCKACSVRQGDPQCILVRDSMEDHYVHCVPLPMYGREAGLFSFIFAAQPHVSEEMEAYLAEIMHLCGVALETLSYRSAVRPSLPSHGDFGTNLIEVETRAIMGERVRLAREIHDGLAQTLAFLKIEVGRAERFLEQGKSDSAARVLHDTGRTLSDAYLDARQAIENLRRVPDGNMADWLKQVAEDFESVAGQNVALDLRLSRDLPINVKVQVIRIVQEALTNVRKHAMASEVRLAARESQDGLLVEVADNGRGFDVASPGAARFGLRGMRERAEGIGADLQVSSCITSGTTVSLRLPVSEAGS